MTKTLISPRSVLLVDEHDHIVGIAEKIHAHQKGLLHRAFSIFIFNQKGEVLMQRRGHKKYHCPGMWTNTCCSHALHGEAIHLTAQKRLAFEMGLTCTLTCVGKFKYKAAAGKNLIEHELDYVFVGTTNNSPRPNGYEVSEYKWACVSSVRKHALKAPKQYSPWLLPALEIATSV